MGYFIFVPNNRLRVLSFPPLTFIISARPKVQPILVRSLADLQFVSSRETIMEAECNNPPAKPKSKSKIRRKTPPRISTTSKSLSAHMRKSQQEKRRSLAKASDEKYIQAGSSVYFIACFIISLTFPGSALALVLTKNTLFDSACYLFAPGEARRGGKKRRSEGRKERSEDIILHNTITNNLQLVVSLPTNPSLQSLTEAWW